MSKFYLVGGAVRDRLLGLNPKDLDYAVEASSYEVMRAEIESRGGKIFVEKPEFLTIRAKVPELGDADFVLCRKEAHYTDGRHPDSVTIGTLEDDLKRRDFTVNAMAVAEDGSLIDLFDGERDLKNKILHTVGHAPDRFEEDYLRLVRAVRFHITKGFAMSDSIKHCLDSRSFCRNLTKVSRERIYEEIRKCFEFDSLKTLRFFEANWAFKETVFVDCGIKLNVRL